MPETSSDKFLKFVDCSMKRFVDQKLRMKKFKIVIDVLESESSVASPLVEKWVRLAADNLVEELHLSFYQLVKKLQYVFNRPNCNLLQRIFGATTTLSSNNCLEDAPPKLKNQFTNLRKFIISGAHLDEQVMLYIIASCPYIQEFVLDRSQGIKVFEISGLDYLEKLEVDGLNFEKVDVDAPKLSKFIYNDNSWLQPRFCQFPSQLFKIVSSNLKELSFWHLRITDQILHDLIAIHPRIETLNLESCDKLKRLRISSHWLKALNIDACCCLTDVEIDAPNLRTFRYFGMLLSSFAHTSPVCIAELDINEGYYFSFFKWSKFLSNSVRFRKLILRMTVHIEVIDDGFEGEGILGETSVPGQWVLEDLDLHVESPYSSYTALSNNILWSCMSKTIRVWKSRKTETSFMRHIYRKLMRRDDYKCSFNNNVACWRHYLKDVVEIIRCDDNICFKLKWD